MRPPDMEPGPLGERTRDRDAEDSDDLEPKVALGADRGEALERLASYREACQVIRHQEGTLGERLGRILGLAQAARSEPDPVTRALAENIVRAQGLWLVEGDRALGRVRVRDRVEAAARKLRARGRDTCPTCEQRLSDPSDWGYWNALRRLELDRLAALDRRGEAA